MPLFDDIGLTEEEIEKRKQAELARLGELIAQEEDKTGQPSKLRAFASELGALDEPKEPVIPPDEAAFGIYPPSGRRPGYTSPGPDTTTARGWLDTVLPEGAIDAAIQAPAGVLATTAELPWLGSAALYGIPAYANYLAGNEPGWAMEGVESGLRGAKAVGGAVDQLFGKPTTLTQSVLRKGGEALSPAGKATLPLSMAMFGIKAGTEGFPIAGEVQTPPPFQPPDWLATAMNDPMALVGQSIIGPAEAANWSDRSPEYKQRYYEQRKTKRQEDAERNKRAIDVIMEKAKQLDKQTPGPLPEDPKNTRELSEIELRALDIYDKAKLAGQDRKLSVPQERAFAKMRVGVPLSSGDLNALAAFIGAEEQAEKIVIDTIGGPQKISKNDYSSLGVMAAASAGMLFGPWTYRMLKEKAFMPLKTFTNDAFGGKPVMPFREIIHAEPGTVGFSTVGDYMRSFDDTNIPLARSLERAGVPQHVVDAMDAGFRMQTGSAAHSFGEAAITLGIARTPSFVFQAPRALTDIAKANNAQLNEYLVMKHTFDDLNIANTPQNFFSPHIRGQERNVLGRAEIRGWNINDVSQRISAIENNPAIGPQAKAFSKDFVDYEKAVRKFESDGEYAMLTKEELNHLNTNRKNYVPYDGTTRGEFRDPNYDFGNVFMSMAKHTNLRIRLKLENEMRGLYIDTMNNQNKYNVRPFQRIDPAEVEASRANYEKAGTLISFKRKGVTEYYTGDPTTVSMLKMDPNFYTSFPSTVLYTTKRGIEMTTTGALRPAFAPIQFWRNYWISKASIPAGREGVSFIGNVKAVGQQTLPPLANAIGESLGRFNNGWLHSIFGKTPIDGLAQRMAQNLQNYHDNSWYARIQPYGTYKNSMMQQQLGGSDMTLHQLRTGMGNPAFQGSTIEATIGRGYLQMLHAMHNAAPFNYAVSNLKAGRPIGETLLEARRLTGDPSVGGTFKGRYQNAGDKFAEFDAKVGKYTLGVASETGRMAVPWYNPTIQGIKRIGEAYKNDPGLFVARMWMYQMLPAAVGALYTHALGKDPNGQSYAEYMMERRSDYRKSMNFYVPIPWQPAEKGLEIPRFHELSIAARLMETAIDHAVRTTIWDERESLMKAAASFAKVAMIPPMPPIGAGLLGAFGIAAPQGIFGEGAYKKTVDPFDVNKSTNANLELVARAFGGSIAEMLFDSYTGALQTPSDLGYKGKVDTVARTVGTGLVRGAPILEDLVGAKRSATGNTPVVEELFEKQKHITDLIRFFNKWDKNKGEINTKPPSFSGDVPSQMVLGKSISHERPGLGMPLEGLSDDYKKFIGLIYDKFAKDATVDKKGEPTESMGYKSAWRRYANASDALRDLNGTYVTWQRRLNERPEVVKYMKSEGVDITNLVEVRNFYERKRQDAGKFILLMIHSAEKQMGKKLEDIKPYAEHKDVEPLKAEELVGTDWVPGMQ